MAFLSRGVDQGGLAGAAGAERVEQLARTYLRVHATQGDEGARSACGLPRRPRGTAVGMSSDDFREDGRPVWDGQV